MKKIQFVALVAALMVGLGLYLFLDSLSSSTEVPTTTVVVAAVDIAENVEITEDMVTTADVPTDMVLSGAVTDVSAVVGEVFDTDIVAGEQLVSSQMITVGENDNSTLAYSVDPGMRAITIAVDETGGLAGMLEAGDTVDIIAQYQLDTEVTTDSGATETKTLATSVLLLQDITVLAVGQTTTASATAVSADSETNTDSTTYTTITLEVTPEQAVKVSYSENTGVLRAVLRSPLDQDVADVTSITSENILLAE